MSSVSNTIHDSKFQHAAKNRYFDPHLQVWTIKVMPGEFYVSTNEDMIVTTLGSCISACIRDKKQGIGGLNHFMLPSSNKGDWGGMSSASTRYGNFAMEHLINEILKKGGLKQNLEAKIFGGGDFMDGNTLRIGDSNVDFAREYLKIEGIPIVNEDIGGNFSRKIYYHPDDGKVIMKKIRITPNDTIERKEKEYAQSIDTQEIAGDIELFT